MFALCFGALAMCAPAVAKVDPAAVPIIAKAREFLGGDDALAAIRSIRFSGTILLQNGTNGDIEIIVRRPMQQRVTISVGSVREVTALSDYDGWRRVENLVNPADWELTLLDAEQIQQLRANTLENIGFYRGVGTEQPDVKYLGDKEVNGVACARLAFDHTGGLRFVRDFNKETGQLVQTVTEDGGVLTEKGEIYVQGIRFPQELTTTKDSGTSTVIFTKIVLNEPFADDLFDVPMLMPGGR